MQLSAERIIRLSCKSYSRNITSTRQAYGADSQKMKIGSPEFQKRSLEVRKAKWGVSCPPQFTAGGVAWVRANREKIRAAARSAERMTAWRARLSMMQEQSIVARREKWGTAVSPKASENAIKSRKGKRIKGLPKIARGSKHCRAKAFHFRSPDNQVFSGTNIRHFVRTHPHLFHPSDVIWRGLFGDEHCRASKGLGGISNPSSKAGSWKGWTMAATSWVSPPGSDLLQRKAA